MTNPTLERIYLTDWFHKLKVTGLNISEMTSNSPFFINSKSVEEHPTQLILILDVEKCYFT